MFYNSGMNKKIFSLIFLLIVAGTLVCADEASDQDYLNKLNYGRNQLQIVTTKRLVDEKRSYSSTNIDITVLS